MKWKNIKSLFVVDDGSDKDSQKIKAPNPPKSKEKEEGNAIIKANKIDKAAPIENNAPSSGKQVAEKGMVKEQFVNHLLKAIEENNMDGIDYLEFKNTLQSFKKMPMDEALRFQSALTAVKTMGASEQKIFDSAQHYLSILAKEEASFKKAVERGKSQKIDGELKRIENLKIARQDKLKKIEEMKKEIESISKEINGSSDKVMEDQVKIDTKRNHFYASYEFVVNQIKRDISELKKYSQPPNTEDNK